MYGKRPHAILGALLLSLFLSVFVYSRDVMFGDIPEVTISSLTNIPQKTLITDRNGEVLYTFFEEDRRYISYEDIPPHVLMAFIATEDRDYRSHDGIDKRGIIRAIVNNTKRLLGKSSLNLQGASTISQQLIKNTYLTSDRSLKRKIQEIIITRKVYRILENNFEDEFPDTPKKEIDLLVKKKILELYINLIFLGNNSYGISTASKHYFGKEVGELDLLESSIIAGLAKAPSAYNPLVDKEAMMGDRQITDGSSSYYLEDEGGNSELFLRQIKKDLQQKLAGGDISTTSADRIDELWKGTFVNNDLVYTYTYAPGRKDYVLRAMYQEGYITAQEVIDAFVSGVDISFSTHNYAIKAPHFVFFVRDYLLKNEAVSHLGLTLNDLLQGGYTIRTSLDYRKQLGAELAATETRNDLKDMGGSSRSLLHIDSDTGEILSYVGSTDYFDNEIHGQYDLIHAKRQQGSTLKPFIFAKLLETYPLGIDGSISDAYLDTGDGPKPRNADGLYTGLRNISRSLNNSRNLTAIRAYLANGGEEVMKTFLRSLGLTGIIEDHYYGWTLALGSAEDSLYHLAQAYLQLSTPHDNVPLLSPILQITGPYGEVLYTNDDKTVERHIPKGNAYQLWTILKNHQEVTPYRREFISYTGLPTYAVKTGTTDIKIDGESLAKEGYVVLYTPDDTILSRAGNIDNTPLKKGVLGSQITKPFVQSYIGNIGDDSFNTNSYDRPNDLTTGNVYSKTRYKQIPQHIKQILRR